MILYKTDSIWLTSLPLASPPTPFGGCSADGDGAVLTILGTNLENEEEKNI